MNPALEGHAPSCPPTFGNGVVRGNGGHDGACPSRCFFASVLLAFVLAIVPSTRAETLTLEDCLREAVTRNPEIARARADLERAHGQAVTFRTRALPVFGVGTVLGYQGARQANELRIPRTADTPDEPPRNPEGIILTPNGQPVFDANGNRLSDTLRGERSSETILLGTSILAQPLFDFAIPSALRRADLEIVSAEHNLASVAVTVLHQVRLTFHAVLFARENVSLQRQVRGRLDENVRTTQQAFDAGISPRAAVLQARVQVQNVGPGILVTEGTGRESRVTLLRLMGRPLGANDPRPEDVNFAGSLLDLPADLDFDPAASRELALGRRPDLQSLRTVVQEFREDARILRAGRYPLVRLFLNGQFVPQSSTTTNEQGLRVADRTRTSELRYGVDFTWNVLDLGAVEGNVAAFRALGEVVSARLVGAEAQVGRDLAGVRARLRAAAARRQSLRTGRAAGEATLNAVTTGTVQGTSSQYELLVAQTDLLSNRTQILQAARDAQDARADFDRITGGYLRFVDKRSGKERREH